MASNSLLEGLVFGRRVAEEIEQNSAAVPLQIDIDVPTRALEEPIRSDQEVVRRLRTRMWDNVGVERDAGRLADAVAEFTKAEADAGRAGARNLAVVGRLVAQAALDREESRGSHYRLDFPQLDESLAERRTVTVDPVPGRTLAVNGHATLEVDR